MYPKKCYQEKTTPGAVWGIGYRGASTQNRMYEFIWYLTHKCSQIIFTQNPKKALTHINAYSTIPLIIYTPIRLYVRPLLSPFTDTYGMFLKYFK